MVEKRRCADDADIYNVPLAVFGLDQGPQGMAGASFSDAELVLILYVWDWIHRLIRDIKLALKDAAGGIFLKAQLYSTHLWTLNMKPFGQKTVSVQKRSILDTFLQREHYNGALFSKYRENIAVAAGVPCSTAEDRQALFWSLSDFRSADLGKELPRVEQWSFKNTPVLPKGGSWFSWNAAAKTQLPEFWPAKMLYESDLREAKDPDTSSIDFDQLERAASAKNPQEQIRALKQSASGIPLAYRLMTHSLHHVCTIIYVATLAFWDWYAKRIEMVKTPRQQLRYLDRRRDTPCSKQEQWNWW